MTTGTGQRRFDDTENGFKRYDATRKRLMDECNLRRERQWKVTTWTGSILLAIMGGVITLHSKSAELALTHAISLTISACTISVIAVTWIRHDAQVAGQYSRWCWQCDEEFGLLFDDRDSKRRHVAHVALLLLLAFTTVAAIWNN